MRLAAAIVIAAASAAPGVYGQDVPKGMVPGGEATSARLTSPGPQKAARRRRLPESSARPAISCSSGSASDTSTRSARWRSRGTTSPMKSSSPWPAPGSGTTRSTPSRTRTGPSHGTRRRRRPSSDRRESVSSVRSPGSSRPASESRQGSSVPPLPARERQSITTSGATPRSPFATRKVDNRRRAGACPNGPLQPATSPGIQTMEVTVATRCVRFDGQGAMRVLGDVAEAVQSLAEAGFVWFDVVQPQPRGTGTPGPCLEPAPVEPRRLPGRVPDPQARHLPRLQLPALQPLPARRRRAGHQRSQSHAGRALRRHGARPGWRGRGVDGPRGANPARAGVGAAGAGLPGACRARSAGGRQVRRRGGPPGSGRGDRGGRLERRAAIRAGGMSSPSAASCWNCAAACTTSARC